MYYNTAVRRILFLSVATVCWLNAGQTGCSTVRSGDPGGERLREITMLHRLSLSLLVCHFYRLVDEHRRINRSLCLSVL